MADTMVVKSDIHTAGKMADQMADQMVDLMADLTDISMADQRAD